MSLEIKNLIVNVHVSGNSSEVKKDQLQALRSEIMEECRVLVNEFVERLKDR